MKEKNLNEENSKEENNINETAKTEKKKNCFLNKKETLILIVSTLVGLILGGALIYVLGILGLPGLGHESILTYKGGRLNKSELYDEMQKKYPIMYILEKTDKIALDKMYDLTDEEKLEIEEKGELIISSNKAYYGYTEEEFFESNGFEDKKEFVDYLELEYKRSLYIIDYFKTLIPEEDIQNYYDNNIYGEINTRHILVRTSTDVDDKQALAIAKEIITKLNKGKGFDEVAEEYKDKTISENVDFDSISESSLAEEYVKASKELEKNEYTKSPVKTDFGYHIIYVVDKKDKPALEEVERDIIEILGENLESEDKYIKFKALTKLREEYNLKFKDKDLKEKYEAYCNGIDEQ